MSKRAVGEEEDVVKNTAKVQAVGHVGPADGETDVLYDITMVVVGEKKTKKTHVLLRKSDLPDAIFELICHVRWDDPEWGLEEISHPLVDEEDDVDPDDDSDRRKKLMLQALLEIDSRHTTSSAEWLTALNFNPKPQQKSKQGYLLALDMCRGKGSIKDVVAQHENVFSSQVAFLRQNTLLNRLTFCVFESWQESVNFKGKN